MKTSKEIKARFQDLFDQQSNLNIKADLANKIRDASMYTLCADKIYKTTIQMRELAWVLDGNVVSEK